MSTNQCCVRPSACPILRCFFGVWLKYSANRQTQLHLILSTGMKVNTFWVSLNNYPPNVITLLYISSISPQKHTHITSKANFFDYQFILPSKFIYINNTGSYISHNYFITGQSRLELSLFIYITADSLALGNSTQSWH